MAPVYNKITDKKKILDNMNLSDIIYIDKSYNDFYGIKKILKTAYPNRCKQRGITPIF